MTTNGVVVLMCYSKDAVEKQQLKDNDCKTVTLPANTLFPNGREMEWCVCDTYGCNSASRSANQVILVFAVASLLKLVLN